MDVAVREGRRHGDRTGGGARGVHHPGGDAESWIGEEWKALLEGGVDQVRLFEDDVEVYGPMSLHAAAES
ncbi:hypothetical protein GCM10020000_58770 [Streptomyces olivoverticillatus]